METSVDGQSLLMGEIEGEPFESGTGGSGDAGGVWSLARRDFSWGSLVDILLFSVVVYLLIVMMTMLVVKVVKMMMKSNMSKGMGG